MPSKAIDQEKGFQIVQHAESDFSAVIVGRDSMSSGLLTDSLIRYLKCDAMAVRSSNLLEVLGARNPDVIIISADIATRLGAGFDLAKAVSCTHPTVPIIILLDLPTHEAVINAFRSGARGVFSRHESVAQFIRCVDHVRKGFIWAEGEETNFVLEAFKSIPAPMSLTEGNSLPLTARELQVVRCAATGKTNKAIASELGLSDHTVKNYLFRAFEKLGVSSRIELLFYLTIRGHSFGPGSAEPQESVRANAKLDHIMPHKRCDSLGKSDHRLGYEAKR